MSILIRPLGVLCMFDDGMVYDDDDNDDDDHWLGNKQQGSL